MSSSNNETMLTTTDNPFNPFTNWEEWFAWDQKAGYNTPAFLARVVRTSSDLSEADQEQAVDDAIDEIIEENVAGIYRRITPDEKVEVST